jgi:hypothetical protein
MLLPAVAAQWRNIGVLLGINDYILEAINHKEEEAHGCLREMLSKWLKCVSLSPSWSKLADAVEPFNEAKAEEIRKAYCNECHPKAYHITTSRN